MLAYAAYVFGGEPATAGPPSDLKVLRAKIGQLDRENDFLKGALIKRRHAERKAMIDEALMREAGFAEIEMFYAGFGFRGWMAFA